LSLRDVPWDQALDIILRANKLGYVVDGTIVPCGPSRCFADEETSRRKLTDEQALSGELRVLTRALSYAKAEDLRPLLVATILSPRGLDSELDARTNTLIINRPSGSAPARVRSALDARFAATPGGESKRASFRRRASLPGRSACSGASQAGATNQIGNTTGLSFPNQGSLTGRTGQIQGPPSPERRLRFAFYPESTWCHWRNDRGGPCARLNQTGAFSTSTSRCLRSRNRDRDACCRRRA
jgi:type IV pilus assembly protein PilQ